MTDEIKVKPVEQKRPSVMIATPMYGGMCTGAYVQGLLFTMRKMAEVGVKTAWCQITNESLITRARNELARIFLESEYDYLMFIDADIGFDGDAVLQLMDADKDVACGIYPKKTNIGRNLSTLVTNTSISRSNTSGNMTGCSWAAFGHRLI